MPGAITCHLLICLITTVYVEQPRLHQVCNINIWYSNNSPFLKGIHLFMPNHCNIYPSTCVGKVSINVCTSASDSDHHTLLVYFQTFFPGQIEITMNIVMRILVVCLLLAILGTISTLVIQILFMCLLWKY